MAIVRKISDHKKGQASIEFLVTIALILLLFSIVMFFAFKKTKESNEFSTLLDAKRFCKSIANNINTIAEQGPGYYKYISIPKTLFGGSSYNISTYSTFVEIAWDSDYSPWSTQIITSNVSIYCNGSSVDNLSRGLMFMNKVYNDDGRVIISCHLPDLKVVKGTMVPREVVGTEDISASMDIVNFGPVDINQKFSIEFNNTDTLNVYFVNVSQIDAEETVTVHVNITSPAMGNYTITLDVDDVIEESIEHNNRYYTEIIEIK